MKAKYYIVELRCGTCGIIFAGSGAKPVSEEEAYAIKKALEKVGPERYVQCKNLCRTDRGEGLIIPNKNYNQRIIVAPVPDEELQS